MIKICAPEWRSVGRKRTFTLARINTHTHTNNTTILYLMRVDVGRRRQRTNERALSSKNSDQQRRCRWRRRRQGAIKIAMCTPGVREWVGRVSLCNANRESSVQTYTRTRQRLSGSSPISVGSTHNIYTQKNTRLFCAGQTEQTLLVQLEYTMKCSVPLNRTHLKV